MLNVHISSRKLSAQANLIIRLVKVQQSNMFVHLVNSSLRCVDITPVLATNSLGGLGVAPFYVNSDSLNELCERNTNHT